MFFLSGPQFKSKERSKLGKRYLFPRRNMSKDKDRPTVHTSGHNSLVTMQKRILPELQWYTLTTPVSSHCLCPFHKMVTNPQSDSTISSDQSPPSYLSRGGWLLALVCWPLLSLKLWDFYALSYTYYRNSIV